MSDPEVLLGCPFCGEAPKDNSRLGGYGFVCRNMHYIQVYGATKNEAIAAWNTRTSTGLELRATIEKLFPADDNGPLTFGQRAGLEMLVREIECLAALSQPQQSEAGDERAAIVAWLREWSNACGFILGKTPGAAWCNALTEAANKIERGDHLKSPPSLTREDENG